MYGAPFQYGQGSNPNAPSQPPHQHPSLSQQQGYMPNLANKQQNRPHISQQQQQQQQFQQDRQRQIMFNQAQAQQGNQSYTTEQMSGGQQGYNAGGMAGMHTNMVNPNVGMMQTGAGGMPHMPAGASGLGKSACLLRRTYLAVFTLYPFMSRLNARRLSVAYGALPCRVSSLLVSAALIKMHS